ncbi:hypothetical protein UF64_16160 [Thalassospira sp. HJ]|uniref:hypothetical protein n=1 Tax=Thalassospira sp. HJ TaxID=1616823 RepID=UPI0005CE5038|nr:hypothetical protein [Thalassospira sp. HJ]KJE33979.1 hypothetical protein UF64_16160 [Thalassospira sp. HJ]
MKHRPGWPGKKDGDPAHDRIAACLATDIQSVPQKAKWVLAEIAAVQNGEAASWEMGMNAYMLKVGEKITEIVPVYEETGEAAISVPTDEFRGALEAWYALISQSPD